MNPTTNHTTVQTMVAPRSRLLVSSSPSASAVPAAAAMTATTWSRPMTPMPVTFPAISCQGRMVLSNSSTTRVDFSSTTPCETSCPAVWRARNSRMPAR